MNIYSRGSIRDAAGNHSIYVPGCARFGRQRGAHVLRDPVYPVIGCSHALYDDRGPLTAVGGQWWPDEPRTDTDEVGR